MTTEVKQKRAINRLQSMYALRSLMDVMLKESQEAKEVGKPVAWCMFEAFASPILNAIGLNSVYPENYGTVCAASGVAETYLERAAADGLPTHLCGYCLNGIGYAARMADLDGEVPPEAPKGGLPKPTFLLASGRTCDARFKFFQALGRYLNAPVYTLESPHTAVGKEALMEGAYEREVNFMVTELKEFIAFMERLLGKKMDWDKLGEDIENTMAMNEVWYQVTDVLRKARPCPMHSRDLWSSMTASFYRAANPQEARELYRKMYDEVKYRVDNKIAGINYEEKYRLSMDGLPPWHSLGFYDKLAERGWNFVIEGAYHPPDPIDLSWVSDPVEKLVRYRYQGLEREIDFNFEPKEAAEVKEEIKRQGFSNRLATKQVRDFQVDGAFLHPLLSCHTSTAGLFLRQSRYLEVARVPCLVIEGDMVDVRVFDPVDAMRKAEAFEETMDHYKRVRKEEGLEW